MIHGLGDRLKTARVSRKLSQREVADLLQVSPGTISNYENSERTPSLEVLMSLARIYQCSTDFLLGFSPADSAQPALSLDSRFSINASMLNEKQRKILQRFLSELG